MHDHAHSSRPGSVISPQPPAAHAHEIAFRACSSFHCTRHTTCQQHFSRQGRCDACTCLYTHQASMVRHRYEIHTKSSRKCCLSAICSFPVILQYKTITRAKPVSHNGTNQSVTHDFLQLPVECPFTSQRRNPSCHFCGSS